MSLLDVLLQHGQLDVGLEGQAPPLGVLVHQLQQVVALHVTPLVHRLLQHVHIAKLKDFKIQSHNYVPKSPLRLHPNLHAQVKSKNQKNWHSFTQRGQNLSRISQA